MPGRISQLKAALVVMLLSACSKYASPPPLLPPDLQELYGVDAVFQALYTLDSKLGVHTVVGAPGAGRLDAPSAMSVRPADGELFVYNNAGGTESRRQWGLLRLDRCTGFATRVGPKTLPRLSMGALAFSPDGRLYGFGKDDGASFTELLEIDPANGDYSSIGPVESSARYSVSAADFHPDGDLYAVGALPDGEDELQVLMIVDTDSGRPVVVGELNRYVGHISAMVFEPSGKILGSGSNADGEKFLFEIDPATAAVGAIRRATVAAQGLGYAPPISC